MQPDQRVKDEVAAQPYPLVFVTISGAHLYGFPSPDSDYDLRGVHILPAKEVVGLTTGPETIEKMKIVSGLEIDLVTHDLKKFCSLLLKKNGYVLEQLYSPLVVTSGPIHDRLKELGRECITRNHAYHYFGFAATQWQLFNKENPHRVKPLLYVFRVLLSGLHLMRTGEVEANLVKLNETVFKLPYLDELVGRKLAGAEKATLGEADLPFYQQEYERLRVELEEAFQTSSLPQAPSSATKAALNELVIGTRLAENV